MSFNRKKQRLRKSNEASKSAATLDRFGGLKIAFTGNIDNQDDLTYCKLDNREPLDLTTLVSLASTSRGMNALFQPIVNHRMLVALAQAVVYGEEDRVIQLLRANPRLVEQKTTVTDYSGREVKNATPFQMALRAGDEVMAKKIKAIYLEANPENGQAVLDAQFKGVFPHRYAAHLKKQKKRAHQFEHDILNPLVAAFDSATPEELQRALDNPDDEHDASAPRQELNKFRAAFHALSLREKVYNPNHLLKVFKKYNVKFNEWHVNDNNLQLRLDLFWRQVIGWELRYMTTNYAQSICTGLENMVDNNQPLQRTLNLYSYDTHREIHFFPLDDDSSSKLGSHFGVYSHITTFHTADRRTLRCVGGGGVLAAVGRRGTLQALQNLCRAKQRGQVSTNNKYVTSELNKYGR